MYSHINAATVSGLSNMSIHIADMLFVYAPWENVDPDILEYCVIYMQVYAGLLTADDDGRAQVCTDYCIIANKIPDTPYMCCISAITTHLEERMNGKFIYGLIGYVDHTQTTNPNKLIIYFFY